MYFGDYLFIHAMFLTKAYNLTELEYMYEYCCRQKQLFILPIKNNPIYPTIVDLAFKKLRLCQQKQQLEHSLENFIS